MFFPAATVYQFYRSFREYFGVSRGENGGEFYNRVRSRFYCVSCPRILVHNGYFSALREVSAHNDYDVIGFYFFFDIVEVIKVSVVEGIIFANGKTNFQKSLLSIDIYR